MTLTVEELDQLLSHCHTTLALGYDDAIDTKNDLHHSIALSVVEAVFSINSTSQATFNTVQRVAEYLNLPSIPDPAIAEVTISEFLKVHEAIGVERMTKEVYCNRQRTSVTNGILKAEAVQRVCQVLQTYGVETWATIDPVFHNPEIEADIRQIPGQKSGVSFRAFCMQLGNTNYIKPDRMLLRFIHSAIGREVSTTVCEATIHTIVHTLQSDFPHLTPRGLDMRIWSYQREQSSK